MVSRLRTLIRFCAFLQTKKYTSFRELNNTPEFKLRNILNDFLILPKYQGGMDQSKYTSSAKTAREALIFLYVFGVVSRDPLAMLVDELTITKIVKHEGEHRLKHSIIPTSIMKSVIRASTEYVEIAKNNLDAFVRTHSTANSRIKLSKTKDHRFAIITPNHKILDEIDKTYSFISRIKPSRLYVSIGFYRNAR